MRITLSWMMAAALLLGACASPAPPEPAPTAGVIRSGSRWQVPGLKHGPVWYSWSPDNTWVGFNLTNGLWAVSADGRTEHPLARGEAWRELAGWWQGALVYLEHRNGDVVVGLARPGQEAREVAVLPLRRSPNNLYIQRHALFGDHLALFPDDRAPLRVNLNSGAAQELGTETFPARCVWAKPSPDLRYVLIKNACEYDPVRVVDLQAWSFRRAAAEGNPFDAVWSPAQNRWAALAGPPGAGNAENDTYATHLSLGDPAGQVVQLKPPQPLKLKGRLHWSADGRRLAVVAEVKPASDGRGRDAVTEVWVVTPATGAWRKLATVQFVHVQGWHPSGKYLVVQKIVGSAAPPDIGTMDAETGAIAWLTLPPIDQQDATRLDPKLQVVGDTAQMTYMDALQLRAPYASWIDYGKGDPAPTLVVEHRPGEGVK